MKLVRVKRILVTVIGFIVLFIGILLIVFPGPAFIVNPMGLTILATEYIWPKKLFEKMKKRIYKTINK